MVIRKWPSAISTPPMMTVRRWPSTAVGDEPAEDRGGVGEAGVEAEKLGGERLRIELAEQELKRRPDGGDADDALDPDRIEQVFHHVEHDQRGVAEIGEPLPRLGREQHREPARMAEDIGRSSGGFRCRIGSAPARSRI